MIIVYPTSLYHFFKRLNKRKNRYVIYRIFRERGLSSYSLIHYLVLRVLYFNEVDTYAESKELNTQELFNGVCLDFCMEILANYEVIPKKMMSAIAEPNQANFVNLNFKVL